MSKAKDGFITELEGPDGLYSVFEDDGDTGYLYIYKPGNGVLRHLHVYDRTPAVDVAAEDVRLAWSDDLAKCGVLIWGQMRGIIDLANNTEGRVWLEGRDSPGIGDSGWLRGFQL